MSHRHLESPLQMNKELCRPWKRIFSAGMDPGKLFLHLQLPKLHGGLPAPSSQPAVVQVRLLSPHLLVFYGKHVVSLIPHFSATSGCWLMAWARPAPGSGHIYEWHFVYSLLVKQAWSLVRFPLPLKWLWTCVLTRDFSSVLQNWCMYRKITQNRAGTELWSSLYKKSSLQTKATRRKQFLSSICLPKLIFKTASGEACTRNSLQCYFYHSNCFP